MNSFEELINYAIRLEQESADYYESMTKRNLRPGIQKFLLEMRDEELKHKKTLEEVLNKHRLPEGKKFYPDPDLKIADYVVDVDETKAELDYHDILVIGMKREKATLNLYRDLAEKTENDELKGVLNYLIEQEAKHKHYFEAEFDDYEG